MELPFSNSDIESLERNQAWREIVRTIQERQSLLQSDFRKINPIEPTGAYSMALIQGQLNELDWFLQQLEVMKTEVDEMLITKRREEEE